MTIRILTSGNTYRLHGAFYWILYENHPKDSGWNGERPLRALKGRRRKVEDMTANCTHFTILSWLSSSKAGDPLYTPFMSIWWGPQDEVKSYRKAWAFGEDKRSQFSLVVRSLKWDNTSWDHKCNPMQDSCQYRNVLMSTQYRKHFCLYVGLFSYMKQVITWIVNAWRVTFREVRNYLGGTFHVHDLILRLVNENNMGREICYLLLHYW